MQIQRFRNPLSNDLLLKVVSYITDPVTTTDELMGTYPVSEPLVAGGIGPAPELPDPDEVREPETVAVEEPLKTP